MEKQARVNVQKTLCALCGRYYWHSSNSHSPFLQFETLLQLNPSRARLKTLSQTLTARTCSHLLASRMRVKMIYTSFWVVPLKGKAHPPLHLLFHAGSDVMVKLS